MRTRADPLSPAALGIETVSVWRRHVSPGQGLIREVQVSLARVRFGDPAAAVGAPSQAERRPSRRKPGASPRW